VKINFRHPVCTHNGPIASSSPSYGTEHNPGSEIDEDPMPRPIASPPGPPLPMVKLPTSLPTPVTLSST
jgi:hypothetical protein